MLQGRPSDPRRNGEGYPDPTAYEALRGEPVDIKRYLRGYLDAEADLRKLEIEIKDLEDMIDSVSQNYDGLPRGTDISDRTGNLAVKLADRKAVLVEAQEKAFEKRAQVVDLIRSLSRDHATILYMRYVENRTFEVIAVAMHYSWKQTHRIYKDALREAERKIY